MGYAYKLGMPVANWEWLVFPALSILLWIFVPLYVRDRITTMPEYLEQRFGPSVRTLYAWLSVASYVFVNFALVFYTGGFALEAMWGIDRLTAVWIMAAITGLYTVYGGLAAVAWTSSFQCILLLGGGMYVFFAGMAKIGWDFPAVLGTRATGALDDAGRPSRGALDGVAHPGPLDQRLVLRHESVHQPALPGGTERVACEDGRAAGGRAAGADAAGHLFPGHDLPRDQSRPEGLQRGLPGRSSPRSCPSGCAGSWRRPSSAPSCRRSPGW